MLTNYWSAPGDDKDHKMVEAVSGNSLLASYSDLRPDGSLTLLVVNKDPENRIQNSYKYKRVYPCKRGKSVEL